MQRVRRVGRIDPDATIGNDGQAFVGICRIAGAYGEPCLGNGRRCGRAQERVERCSLLHRVEEPPQIDRHAVFTAPRAAVVQLTALQPRVAYDAEVSLAPDEIVHDGRRGRRGLRDHRG